MDLYKDKDTIAAGRRHTVGLKSDGTVAAVGNNRYGQCNVSGWRDIVAVAAGDNEYGQCDVSGWRGIQLTGNIKVK
jgi:alpha-tubulin suppressor-like RCC1 family protein